MTPIIPGTQLSAKHTGKRILQIFPSGIDGLAQFAKLDEARRAKLRTELQAHMPFTPVPDDIAQMVADLGSNDQKAVLRHHPGHQMARRLDSLWAMLEVFEKVVIDLNTQLERFHEFSSTEAMHRRIGGAELQAIELAVKKEVVAFSASAVALVDLSRRTAKLVAIPGFDEKRRTSFDEAEHEFVKGLRNAIFHIELPTIGWQISYGKTKTTDFVLPVDGLRHHAELGPKALAFLDRSGKTVSVRGVAVAYAARVRGFYAWFKQAIELHTPANLSDFRRIKRLCLATASRQSYRLLVGLALERKIDPYPRLSQHLLPGELAIALAMPMRSREQVDFIISIVDEHQGCDEALRRQVYTLFGAM